MTNRFNPKHNPEITHWHPEMMVKIGGAPYDGSGSGLDAETISDAIDELADDIAAVGTPDATDVAVTDTADYFTGTNVETILAEFGLAHASVFNVRLYGATGDGSTADRTAVNLAIAAWNAAGFGVLYFPAGHYIISDALTTITAFGMVRGDGGTNYDASAGSTIIECTSATADLFTVTSDRVRFEHLALFNDTGTESDGAAIVADGNVSGRVDLHDVSIDGFYVGYEVKVGAMWVVSESYFRRQALYGVQINNTDNADNGDWAISDCEFEGRTGAQSAIRIESSGGGKVINSKINQHSTAGKYVHGIQLAVTTGINTILLQVSNCSIENITTHGIAVTSTGTGQWRHLIFHGNQFGLWTNNSGKAISIAPTNTGDVEDIVISSNVLHTNGTARSAIQLTNTDNVILSSNLLSGFNALYSNSGSTNVVEVGAGSTPTAHATSHEDGGSDEIDVTGLSGLLEDPQTPATHASSHQNGGGDEVSVAGLSGELADPQPPKAHASSHEPGGGDAMDVDAAANVGSLRTLGTGATQAALGNHTHAGSAAGYDSVLTNGDPDNPELIFASGDVVMVFIPA
jgi:hypothetical protein